LARIKKGKESVKFYNQKIQSLKTTGKQYAVWETAIWGLGALGVRVSKHGRKSWVYNYRFGGRKRFLTLGKYPLTTVAQAHQMTADIQLKLERGIDPSIDLKTTQQKCTFKNLADLYIEEYAKVRKRTWKEDQQKLNKDLLPVWKNKPIENITKTMIFSLLDQKAITAPVQANRLLRLLRIIFQFGTDRQLIKISPLYNLKRSLIYKS